ncbi:hypothetical protein L6452_22574 [Arctium lappa]|uniref:Uncharacterized protein n=1 Tax=Arctium lappa TaxID=4217 RepID=A0ACB9B0I9_ARCLA|nr:hypothetical protein L6452_22574 [Arctium lappa]
MSTDTFGAEDDASYGFFTEVVRGSGLVTVCRGSEAIADLVDLLISNPSSSSFSTLFTGTCASILTLGCNSGRGAEVLIDADMDLDFVGSSVVEVEASTFASVDGAKGSSLRAIGLVGFATFIAMSVVASSGIEARSLLSLLCLFLCGSSIEASRIILTKKLRTLGTKALYPIAEALRAKIVQAVYGKRSGEWSATGYAAVAREDSCGVCGRRRFEESNQSTVE